MERKKTEHNITSVLLMKKSSFTANGAENFLSTSKTLHNATNMDKKNTENVVTIPHKIGYGPVDLKKITRETNYESNPLSKKYQINPNEIIDDKLPANFKGDSKFIPQSMLKGLTGQAAAYAVSKGDYFGGVTFLSEGVRSKAFYFDPASGSRGKGVLINTHPGITLPYQSESEIRKIFGNTSLSPMTDEIIRGVKHGQMTNNMRQAQLRVGDYYNMFKHVQDKYSAGAHNALLGVISQNPFAKELLSEGKSKQEVLKEVKENLPVTSYAVLQHLAYKYGNGGIKKFTSLLNATISAGLDTENQEEHLAKGAKHIVYHYRDGKNTLHQDTRVMNIHRLFYTAGVRFSPELNMKIVGNKELTQEEEKLVNEVSKEAGLGKLVDKGKIKLPDGTINSTKNSKSDKMELEVESANKGISTVNQNFKPIPKVEKIEVDDIKPKNDNTVEINKPKPSPKPKSDSGGSGCISFSCFGMK